MIIWLSVKEGTPARGYWDQRLLEELFVDEVHLETNHISELMPNAIVVIPGAYQADYIDEINRQLDKIYKCTVIITSDEENNFPIDKLDHRDLRIFANYYNPKYKSNVHWLPIGPANVFKTSLPEKTNEFVFAGQVTHEKRHKYVEQLRKRNDGVLLETKGFAQGKSPEEYFQLLCSAKVAPSPAGNISPDAFRTYEAIHAGAVPIPIDLSFHEEVFNSFPFPVIEKYEQINGYIDDSIKDYPNLNNHIQAWWLQYKRHKKIELLGIKESPITVMVPCSPVKSHPNTEIIDETIRSIRHHLPDAEIIVTFDGVREEQKDRTKDYYEFIRRFLWKCYNETDYNNILPIIYKTHMHQVAMAKDSLQYVNSTNVLYVEQDTPLVTDMDIEWDKCLDLISSGQANLIRFHFEASIPEPHKHLMIGEPENGFLKTYQWSQRPHLISKPYFKSILDKNFSENAICFIEDKMHSVVQVDVSSDGLLGWFQHRIWIYHPENNIKRSYHTDGRAGELKWDNQQKW